MYQVVVMMGRLTDDPELRHTTNDIAVATFSIAVDRPYKVNGEEKADFFDVVAWRGLGEFVCKHFKKGKPIVIQGRFENRSYKNKNGEKRWVTELIADECRFAGDSSGKKGGSLPEPPPDPKENKADDKNSAKPADLAPAYAGGNSSDFTEVPADDDLPF